MIRIRISRIATVLLVLLLALPAGSWADNTASVRSTASSSCPDPVKGRSFEDKFLATLLALPTDFDPTVITCVFMAKNEESDAENHGQKGIKGTGSGQILNPFGGTIATINWPIKTNSQGYDSIDIDPDLFPGLAGLTVDVNLKGKGKLNQAGAGVPGRQGGALPGGWHHPVSQGQPFQGRGRLGGPLARLGEWHGAQ